MAERVRFVIIIKIHAVVYVSSLLILNAGCPAEVRVTSGGVIVGVGRGIHEC
jgi:hypothetical protein